MNDLGMISIGIDSTKHDICISQPIGLRIKWIPRPDLKSQINCETCWQGEQPVEKGGYS